MGVEQFQATAHLQGGTLVKVRSRGFEFNLDEPKDLGGTDTANEFSGDFIGCAWCLPGYCR